MKRCHKCKIDIETNRTTCPLCREILIVKDQNNYISQDYLSHNEIVNPKRHLLRKIFIFASIVVSALAIIINYLTFQYGGSYWSLIVVASIVYLWSLIRGTILSRKNIAWRLLLQALFLGILLYFIELVAKNNQENFSPWLIPYMIPFIMMFTTLSITILILSKTMRYRDYMLYLIMLAFIGFIPIIFILIPHTRSLFNQIYWPSIACAIYAGVTLLGMFIFGDRQTKDEFKKRFHI